jgi:hypothetical protein
MRIRLRCILWHGTALCSLFLFQPCAGADSPKRVLYMTHSAGCVHDSIPTSCSVMQDLATRSGQFEVLCSEDLSLIAADSLRNFDTRLDRRLFQWTPLGSGSLHQC